MPPRISLAMIVKNEGARLESFLEHIKDTVNEVCLVDTGSADDTIEIARKAGARISVYIWSDDFSAARNESLRLCEQDWILVLDADERMTPEDQIKLRRLAQGPQDCCYRFATRNYTNNRDIEEFQPCAPNDPNAKGFAGWFPSHKVRLFPNRKGGKFEGKVHELVNESLEKAGIRVLDSDIPVHHYGQDRPPAEIRDKQALYLQLGHAKIRENPKDVKGFIELGKQYSEVADHANAAGAYREALKLDPNNVEALCQLGGMLFMLKRYDDALKSLSLAVRLNPNVPSAWRNLGVVHAEHKRWNEAYDCFNRAMSLDAAWIEGPRYLAVCLEGLGRLEEAAEQAGRVLKAIPDSNEALKLFVHLQLRLERRAAAREFIQGIIDSGSKNPELHNVLGELCFYDQLFDESKAHFRTAAGMGIPAAWNNLGVVHFSLKEYADAQSAFEKCLSADPGHTGAQRNMQKLHETQHSSA